MTTPGAGRSFLPAIVAFFLSSVAIGATPAPDPWAKVPPFPTGCYSSRDSFAKDTDTAIEAMSADVARQEELNGSVKDALTNLDAMEKQRRMQSYLMSNPQEAAKMMQANQAAGAEYQGTAMEHNERGVRLDEELKTLEAQYDAALAKAMAPLDAKIKALDLNDGEGGNPPELIDQWKALVAKHNVEYEKVCGEWWSASGPIHGWLRRYKEQLREDAPLRGKMEDAALMQYKMMGVATDSYRSTDTMKSVETYMKRALNVFGRRWTEPMKSQ